jgi:hypothetical protein
MDKKTAFGDIAIGSKFIFPGWSQVFIKRSATSYQAENVKRARRQVASATDFVVPERDAFCADILGSWSAM